MKYIYLFLSLFFAISQAQPLAAQTDSSWNVLLLSKSKKIEQKEDMRSFSNTGFYLYKNCVYEFKSSNNDFFSGRLINVKPDSLYFSNFLNEHVAQHANQKLDTIAFHYKQLKKLRLISDRSMGLYTTHTLSQFDFIFSKDTAANELASSWAKIYVNDTNTYELVPHLTAQGVNLLFEENGKSYYFYGGGMEKPDLSEVDTTYTAKTFLWFTPCNVERIDGIALGLFAENIKNDRYNIKDSLLINGINIEINPFALFAIMNPYVNGVKPDSIDFYRNQLKKEIGLTVNGLNLGIVMIRDAKVSGINLSGSKTVLGEMDGLNLSGISSFSYILRGISIAGLYNRATDAKGLQIGLYNKATDMKGIQIGLWNVNGRRALPFFNWQFKQS